MGREGGSGRFGAALPSVTMWRTGEGGPNLPFDARGPLLTLAARGVAAYLMWPVLDDQDHYGFAERAQKQNGGCNELN